jgi:tetratricopeptide (TPR) repeat protein
MSAAAVMARTHEGGTSMSPELAAALRALAQEDLALGRAQLEALLEANPADADAWAYLSGVRLADANAEGAAAASERALALDPDGFAPRIKAGELALRLGDLETAERWFVAALRAVDPGTSGALAAKRALVIVRTKRRGAIAHGASLPKLRLALPWRRGAGITTEGAR